MSDNRFAALSWENDDIETIEHFRFDDVDARQPLYRNFEEFVYRHPQLLTSGTNTTLVADLDPMVEIPLIGEEEARQLLNYGWDTDEETHRWIISSQPHSGIMAATLVEKPLLRFLERSFFPLPVVPAILPFIDKWTASEKILSATEPKLDVYIDNYGDNFYFGFFKDGKLLMTPVYKRAADPLNIIFFIKETIKVLSPEGCVRLHADTGNEALRQFVEALGESYEIVESVFQSKSSFKTYIWDSVEVIEPVKAAILFTL